MIKYVYNKEMDVTNRDPHIIDLYPDSTDMSWYAIYHSENGDTKEWHIKAHNMNEAIGTFFVENEYAMYSEIIDHMEIA